MVKLSIVVIVMTGRRAIGFRLWSHGPYGHSERHKPGYIIQILIHWTVNFIVLSSQILHTGACSSKAIHNRSYARETVRWHLHELRQIHRDRSYSENAKATSDIDRFPIHRHQYHNKHQSYQLFGIEWVNRCGTLSKLTELVVRLPHVTVLQLGSYKSTKFFKRKQISIHRLTTCWIWLKLVLPIFRDLLW